MTEFAWHQRAVCKCGWHHACPFGDLFHLHCGVCPHCGTKKHDGMTIKIARWIGESVWWKPWTWDDKRIEWKDSGNEDRKASQGTAAAMQTDAASTL